MKVEGSRAAAARYVIRKDHLGAYPDVPDDYGPVHAVLLDTRASPWRRKERRKYLELHHEVFMEFAAEEAACGHRVRLIFPLSFDTDEDDACPTCLEMVGLWLNDRDEFDRRVSERSRRQWVRWDREREDEQAEQDYLEFLKRQDADLQRRSHQQRRSEAG